MIPKPLIFVISIMCAFFITIEITSFVITNHQIEELQSADPSAEPSYNFPDSITDFSVTKTDGEVVTISSSDCQLPCIIGVTPGKTEWKKLLTILSDNNMVDLDASKNNKSDLIQSSLTSNDLNLLFTFYRKNDMVLGIKVLITPISPDQWINSPFLQLKNTFAKMGAMTNITIGFDGPKHNPRYHLWMIYDYVGVMEEYSGDTLNQEICPVSQTDQIVYYLTDPTLDWMLPINNQNVDGFYYLTQGTDINDKSFITRTFSEEASFCFSWNIPDGYPTMPFQYPYD